MTRQLMPALRAVIFLTVLTGLLYPAVVTGICQVLFRDKANGSLIRKDGQVIGSSLLGQNFSKPEYFHPRPSAAGNDGYDASASGGSNLGPTSQKLHNRVKTSADQFRKDNPSFSGPIPADALTASGSGLDPDISVANAQAQAARGAAASDLEQLVQSSVEQRGLGFLGEPRLNVLKINLALDQRYPLHR